MATVTQESLQAFHERAKAARYHIACFLDCERLAAGAGLDPEQRTKFSRIMVRHLDAIVLGVPDRVSPDEQAAEAFLTEANADHLGEWKVDACGSVRTAHAWALTVAAQMSFADPLEAREANEWDGVDLSGDGVLVADVETDQGETRVLMEFPALREAARAAAVEIDREFYRAKGRLRDLGNGTGVPVNPGGSVRSRGSRRDAEQKRRMQMSHAMVLVAESPHLSDREIAEHVGVHPSTLCKWREYKTAAQLARQGFETKRGFVHRDEDGKRDVDAVQGRLPSRRRLRGPEASSEDD